LEKGAQYTAKDRTFRYGPISQFKYVTNMHLTVSFRKLWKKQNPELCRLIIIQKTKTSLTDAFILIYLNKKRIAKKWDEAIDVLHLYKSKKMF